MVNKKTAGENRLNRLNDIFFKSLLGSKDRKDLTLNFINRILRPDGNNCFVDINFNDKQIIPVVEFEKAPELDILATLNDGTVIDIEVQVAKQDFIAQRSAFYLCGMYYHQLGRGDYYNKLKQSVAINLLGFNHFAYEEYHSSYHMRHDKCGDLLFKDLEMHFIELKKFKFSDVKNLYSPDNWIAYFSPKCTDKQREEIAMHDPAIKEAVDYEKSFSQNVTKWWQYEQKEKAARDAEGIKRYNRRIGQEEGLIKGKLEEKRSTIVNSLNAGLDFDTIAKITDSSVDEVKAVQQKLKSK